MKNHDVVVQTSCAHMPQSCMGRYRNVAVLIVDRAILPEGWPAMISARARGVVSVVWHSGPVSCGTLGDRGAKNGYARALAYAEIIAKKEIAKIKRRNSAQARAFKQAVFDVERLSR